MSVIREAIVLPILLLTVALAGGVRAGSSIHFVPPPLAALVLGLLLLAALAGSGAVAPGERINSARSGLENASGAMVLLSLAAASVQIFNLLTPERGLLHVLFGTFFFVQLLTTIAGTRDRRALLRSLTVLLGSAFVLRFIVLESLYARTGGTLNRVLTTLMEGVSLGSLQYAPNGAVTGYVAFAAIVLYVIAVCLMGGEVSRESSVVSRGSVGSRESVVGGQSSVGRPSSVGRQSSVGRPSSDAADRRLPSADVDRPSNGD